MLYVYYNKDSVAYFSTECHHNFGISDLDIIISKSLIPKILVVMPTILYKET